jgi:hypothetical protein
LYILFVGWLLFDCLLIAGWLLLLILCWLFLGVGRGRNGDLRFDDPVVLFLQIFNVLCDQFLKIFFAGLFLGLGVFQFEGPLVGRDFPELWGVRSAICFVTLGAASLSVLQVPRLSVACFVLLGADALLGIFVVVLELVESGGEGGGRNFNDNFVWFIDDFQFADIEVDFVHILYIS